MTIATGKRHVIPRGTLVYDHVHRCEERRRTTYPVHIERIEGGRAYWFGDQHRMMSCEAAAVDLKHPCGPRSPQRGAC